MPFRYTLREKDFLPNMNTPDTRPSSLIEKKKDWGADDSGAVLVQLGDRAHMVVTVEELIKHAARRGGGEKEEEHV